MTRYIRSAVRWFISLEMSGGFGLNLSPNENFELIKDVIVWDIRSWNWKSFQASVAGTLNCSPPMPENGGFYIRKWTCINICCE